MVLFPDFETGGSQFISRQNEWSWEMVLIYIYNYFCLWNLLPRRKKYLSDFSLCITWCTQGEEVARCACVNPAVFKSSDMVGAVLALQCWIAVGLCSYHLTSLVLKFFSLQHYDLWLDRFCHFAIQNHVIESLPFYLLGHFFWHLPSQKWSVCVDKSWKIWKWR